MCNLRKTFFSFMGIVGLLLLFFFFIIQTSFMKCANQSTHSTKTSRIQSIVWFCRRTQWKEIVIFWEIFQFFKLIFKTQPISKEQLRNSKVFCTQTGILHPVWKNSTPDTSGSYTCTKIFKHILPSFHPTQYILPPSGQAFRAPTVYHTAYWVHNQ